jgi:uncharacterized protein YbjT (DUF2867 family)
MKILVFGGAGLLGSAIAHEMRLRHHSVVTVGRRNCDVTLDLAHEAQTDVLTALLRGVDVVVNAVGILTEHESNRFEAVHVKAPRAIAQACDEARVARLVHVSALGTERADIPMLRTERADIPMLRAERADIRKPSAERADPPASHSDASIPGAYLRSKLAGERAVVDVLYGSSTDVAIVRPSLLVDDVCPSTRLFRFLATLPVIALPGLLRPGASRLAPIHVRDVAECIARICEHEKALKNRNGGVIELAGPEIMRYRELMASYRAQAGGKFTLWLPLPWWLMSLSARLAECIPGNRVFSRDTVRLLRADILSQRNEAMYWLRRMPVSIPKEPFARMESAQSAIKEIANTL